MHSQAIEDYLKTIYELQCAEGQVGTSLLAERLGITPASATGMIKKLAEMKLVVHERYQGVKLTKAGQKIALEVVRHHRLVEQFLAEALGVSWDRVHEEAHKIEHVISDDIEERLDAMLGHPTTDPHGSPIPRSDGTIDESASTRLAELQAGQSAIVAEVSDHDSALLRYLGELGLYPDTAVTVMAVAPLDGLMTVRVGNKQHALSHAVANEVLVAGVRG
jgi:DtxR family Mn-dependent transcriptional regulator